MSKAFGLISRVLCTCATLILIVGCGAASLDPAASLKGPADPNRLLTLQGNPRRKLEGDASRVGMWGSNNQFSLLYGMDKKGTEVLATINVGANKCYNPVTVKVDHERNVWVACEVLNFSNLAEFGGEQEYGPTGTVKNSYAYDASQFCGSGYSFCLAESDDGGPDDEGHVFAELSGGDTVIGQQAQYMNPGFYWWNAIDPATPGTFIRGSRYCKPFCAIHYMDTDRAGNIWFDFATRSGDGLGEVTTPTKLPKVKIILPAGTYGYAAGVYVSNHGSVLNVTDQDSRETYQYHLPVSKRSKPFNVLGPTLPDSGGGRPTTGGFNKDDSAFALGDYYAWINIGNVPANTWSHSAENGCQGPCLGVAYTPSDK